MTRTTADYPERCFDERSIANLKIAIQLAQKPGGESWQDLLLVMVGAQPGSAYTAHGASKSNPELAQALLDWFATLPEPGPHDIDLWVPGARSVFSGWLQY